MGYEESDFMEIAEQLRSDGYNCAQTVVCTFSSEMGLDRELLYRISEGFGSGMGGTYGTCGALSGAIMVLSHLLSMGDPNMPSKQETYLWIEKLYETFTKDFGSPICREIKGLETNEKLYECGDLIMETVRLTYRTIQEMGEYYEKLLLLHADESSIR